MDAIPGGKGVRRGHTPSGTLGRLRTLVGPSPVIHTQAPPRLGLCQAGLGGGLCDKGPGWAGG